MVLTQIRIDKFPDLFSSSEEVLFEAVVKFSDGRVEVSHPAYTKQQAIQFARQLIKHYRPNNSYPPAYQQSREEASKMWEPGYLVESSEFINYQQAN